MNTYARKLIFFIALIFLLFSLTACERQYYNRRNLVNAFNTNSYVDIFTKKPLSEKELETLDNDLNKILTDLDNLFNIQKRGSQEPDTVLYQIGKMSGTEAVNVSGEVIHVLKKAIEMSEISKVTIGEKEVALFDPTIAPAWKVWDFPNNQYDFLSHNTISEEELLEMKQEIESIISRGLIDYKKIEINEEESTVYLKEKGMEIDLGAIAKGYAADKIKEYLVGRGYTSCIINIGGNVLLIGNLFGKDFEIGIRAPYSNFLNARYDKDGKHINGTFGSIYVSDHSIVTSGTYEKYIKDENGIEYHHILDPSTGMPIENNVVSVTVITDESTLADGYSTTLFALGMERAMEIVESNEDLETVWVVRNGGKMEVYISSGLEGKFVFNEHVIEDGFVYKGVYGNENA